MIKTEARNQAGAVLYVIFAVILVTLVFWAMFRFSAWLDKKVPSPSSREADKIIYQLQQESAERE